ncbi:hypothetical protein GCM10011591_25820 [Nocardia camponoti]|uniref:Uncharacterized protein n=1 Tax=Nocardia camponoti TaxID=1616106 RepID=A0A917QJ00_9NOCA|nr:hypothetical protein GCM10011591_25820 [Nocardia camponoti]
MWEEVAVRLVLDLAQRCLTVPQVRGAREEAEWVFGEVVLGICDGEPGCLREGQYEGEDYRTDEPAPTERRSING